MNTPRPLGKATPIVTMTLSTASHFTIQNLIVSHIPLTLVPDYFTYPRMINHVILLVALFNKCRKRKFMYTSSSSEHHFSQIKGQCMTTNPEAFCVCRSHVLNYFLENSWASHRLLGRAYFRPFKLAPSSGLDEGGVGGRRAPTRHLQVGNAVERCRPELPGQTSGWAAKGGTAAAANAPERAAYRLSDGKALS